MDRGEARHLGEEGGEEDGEEEAYGGAQGGGHDHLGGEASEALQAGFQRPLQPWPQEEAGEEARQGQVEPVEGEEGGALGKEPPVLQKPREAQPEQGEGEVDEVPRLHARYASTAS